MPDVWSFIYNSSGCDKDSAVSGESAMWEFIKTADGSFELTDSSGSILFTPTIRFGDDRMSYRVHFESKLLGLAGSTCFDSAPHSITPHSTISDILLRQKLILDSTTYDTPVPRYFRGYVLQNPAAANELRARASEVASVWRVYINGELINGLPVTLPSTFFNTPVGRFETSKDFILLYERRIPLSAIESVRIEFGD